MQIKFIDLAKQYKPIRKDLERAYRRVLTSSNFILGTEVETFEEEVAQFLGAKYCVGVGSGTDAITLSLMALGFGSGKIVGAPAFTAFPTIVGIMRSGAEPLLYEGFGPLMISAYVVVNLYGFRKKWFCANGVTIIEDCAQSFGVGKPRGVCSAYSFYPTKILGAEGDGGMVATNSYEVYKKLKALRDYGQTSKNVFAYPGFNSRLDELQAALLRVKLKHVRRWLARRIAISKKYAEAFGGEPTPQHFVTRSFKRETVRKKLLELGIQTLVHYPYVCNQHKAFPLQRQTSFPIAEELSKTVFSLPLHPAMTDDEVDYVIEKTHKVLMETR